MGQLKENEKKQTKKPQPCSAFGTWPWFLYMQIEFPVHGTQPSKAPCHQRVLTLTLLRDLLFQGCLDGFCSQGISRTHWGILQGAFLVLQLRLHLCKTWGPCAGLSLPAHVPPVPSPWVPSAVFGAASSSSPLVHRNFGTFIWLVFFFAPRCFLPLFLLYWLIFKKEKREKKERKKEKSAICLFQRCQFW